ncbi:hypothetical protein A2130_00205 [Candidatus Woesebacteria bacterium GWC2_33_12]|uniref:Uncharacterized protein n=1 Tax=Candidatus Woesebacteria bacterium GW2011_GWB1_33_22 TaxID=1618566 RepID=A0A0F9ZKP3_9BACT|nr:MAG: hypothetical protein UR29_C0010G0032 [Candidatus Woesebacteria bacterium GW2011_GWC2_33_12]KKP42057.1 MAG: hypothetical protein UR33_C0006G0041 [Candidatus Woesebacteria bacterium GW2011_GWA2_33_20]KKP44793.1 MAG: hypothetical protein UR35_C0006G0028 [Candidatus Woesebacteria bacterium GW2011_GWB1_33_22]KKP46612.1 MAG: hypothetical protein UR37_C0006G0062 [Microgenomates group bacterium GW2011_GWC1_33_28]KKP50525.1 MAG: hypothetical protein UR41_C0006G0028 [Candidatus Woesebacteria bact
MNKHQKLQLTKITCYYERKQVNNRSTNKPLLSKQAKSEYTKADNKSQRRSSTLIGAMYRTQRGVTLVGFDASSLRILGVIPLCCQKAVILMKEYKFISFSDDKKGRKQMQEAIDNLSSEGWKIDKTETVSGGWNVLKAILLGILFLPLAFFGKRKPLTKIMLSRTKKGEK